MKSKNLIIFVYISFVFVLAINAENDSTIIRKRKSSPYEDVWSKKGWEKEKTAYFDSYNKPIEVDTILKKFKNDKIRIKYKYYCLNDSAIKLPKMYLWWTKAKTFTTHNFAVDLLIIKNDSIILKKTITKHDLNKIVKDKDQRKFAINCGFYFYKYIAKKDKIIFNLSYSIPLTDVGVGLEMIINSKGQYKFVDE
jgi:hypothetical protein